MKSALQDLPEIQAFDWQGSKPDVLLSAAGFEDRTLALLGLAPESLRGVMGCFSFIGTGSITIRLLSSWQDFEPRDLLSGAALSSHMTGSTRTASPTLWVKL